jgi:thioredoxin reductase (NADPH)
MVADPALLIVEADNDMRALLEGDLRPRYGNRYRILTAASEGEAMQTLEGLHSSKEHVALLAVAQRLPGLAGVDLLQKAGPLAPGAKRVLVTTFEEAEAAIDAIKKVRIDHYLVKPWQPPELHLYPVLDDLLADWEAAVRPTLSAPCVVVGYRFSPQAHKTRDFLVRNCEPFQWLDLERDPEARRLLAAAGLKASRLPIVRFADGTQLVQPTDGELAEKIGLRVRPQSSLYDLVIVGAGPAGLAAAVSAASEGLRTVMIERYAPGGQAGLSSMIENYLGFPAGLSGADLARRAVAQARKFEVEIVTAQAMTGLRAEGPLRAVSLEDGTQIRSHAVLVATGVQWRRLQAAGVDRLTGAGVYYGGSQAEAFFCRNEDVYVVGGGNSAGQAALHFARYARTVTLLVRDESLTETMSRYLIEQIEATDNVEVRLRTIVVEAHGEERLEAISVLDTATGTKETLPTSALFIFIGGEPNTQVLAGVLEQDGSGFIVTGPDLSSEGGDRHRPKDWPLDRDPFWLESSVPGVLAAGDVRHGSVKRVAAGVGEGSSAVQFVHQHLRSTSSK